MHTVINNPLELMKRIPGVKRTNLPKNNIREVLDRSIVFNFLKRNLKNSEDIFAKERVSSFTAITGNDGRISVIESFKKQGGKQKYLITSEFDSFSGDLLNKQMHDGTLIWTGRVNGEEIRKVYKNINGIESIKVVKKGEPIFIIEKNGEVVSEYTKSAHLNKSSVKTSSSHYITTDKRSLEDSDGMYLASQVLENRVTLKDGREFVRSFNGNDSTLIVSNKNNQIVKTVLGNENIEKYIAKLSEEAQSALNAHMSY